MQRRAWALEVFLGMVCLNVEGCSCMYILLNRIYIFWLRLNVELVYSLAFVRRYIFRLCEWIRGPLSKVNESLSRDISRYLWALKSEASSSNS